MEDMTYQPVSGDMCSLAKGPHGAVVRHYRCDDYADGTITRVMDGVVVRQASPGALKGFSR